MSMLLFVMVILLDSALPMLVAITPYVIAPSESSIVVLIHVHVMLLLSITMLFALFPTCIPSQYLSPVTSMVFSVIVMFSTLLRQSMA